VGKVLAVVSQKGGVGKTTTAINLAAALAKRGTKTLLIDSDPQGSVRYGLGLSSAATRVGLSDFLSGAREMHEVVRTTALPWLRVVSAGSVTESPTHDAYLRDLAESPRTSELLDRARERGYTVVVDTPPGLGPVVHRVLACSQHVLIPLQCEPLALQTTTQILRGIRASLAENPSLTLDGILLTMVEPENPASQRVAAYVREQLPKGLVLDMVVPRTNASIDAFAAAWDGPLHVLVANAGVMATPEQHTSQGRELQFATNHLGHFTLTTGLHDALAAAGNARVVITSSVGHLRSEVHFDDVHCEQREYTPFGAYGQSKTANILFAVEADRRWQGDGIRVNALHPGAIRTNLARHVDMAELERLRAQVNTPFQWKSLTQGAATQVLLATSPLVEGIGGEYFEDCAIAEPHEQGVYRGVAGYAKDPDNAARLWDLSLDLTT